MGLITFRVLAFCILVLLLANPVFERTQSVHKKPIISILIDNSASLGAVSPSWDGIQSYSEVLEIVSRINTDIYTPNYLFFNSSIQDSVNIGNIQLDGAQTDIYSVVRSVITDYESDEIILITDGISTKGRDPLYSAQDNRTPIHTIAVGDSTLKKDLILQDVNFPPITLINTQYPISAIIRNVELMGSSTTVKLYQNDDLIDSKTISFDQQNSTQQIEFQIEHLTTGIYNYSMVIDSLNGEWTSINNEKSFDISSKDDQVNILYISSEVHPDVGAIRSIIENYGSFNMMTRTWIQGNRFVEGSLPTRRDTLDLVIIHGLNKSLPESVIEFIQETIPNNNTLFINSPSTDSRLINTIYSSLGLFSASDERIKNNLQLNPSPNSAGHVIMDIPQINWTRTPLIRSNLILSDISDRLNVIFNSTDKITQQNYPAITITTIGSRRHSMLLFSGVSTLLLTANQNDQESLHTLLGNIITWTSTSNSDDNFTVTIPENEISASDKIEMNAQLLNDLGLPEDGATISLNLESDDNSENRSYLFKFTNSGNYELEIPTLPVGNYKFEAIAEKAQQKLGAQVGSFTIGNTKSEFINTLRNDGMLRTLAEFTHGNFIQHDKIQDINSLISQKDPIIETKSEVIQLFRNPLWFIVIILLLSIEWYFRRKVLIP